FVSCGTSAATYGPRSRLSCRRRGAPMAPCSTPGEAQTFQIWRNRLLEITNAALNAPPDIAGLATCGSVGRDYRARAGHLAVSQPQRSERAVVAEQALAAARHQRVDHQPELVQQAQGHQGLDEPGAADHMQVLTPLRLQCAHGRTDVASQQPRILPAER